MRNNKEEFSISKEKIDMSNLKKLRIKKVDAIYFSLSKYMRLEGQFQAKNFQTAYFLQVRILGFWFTIQTYISIDSNYALLCATEAMEKLQEKL